ncbi:UNVERIFIED_CONTAM: hypothetical protein RMT77_000950 [Armadillidium vulgare]
MSFKDKADLFPVSQLDSMKDDKETTLSELYDKPEESNSTNGDGTTIRSVAVVKKSQVEFPVTFRELQSNTDIKTPPSNWLRGQFSICLPNLTPKRSDFTSFIMGYQFPDCIGEVDIVSDAENIKKLLKMAYKPNTHLSMMVHRIGKTILIDDFDIYKYLLRRGHNEWKWLRKFFYEHVLESLDERKEQNVIVRPDKSRDVVQSRNLLSKFLYHSIEGNVKQTTPEQEGGESPVSVKALSSPTKDASGELLAEEHMPDCSVQTFARNVIWNFEDVRMLIGTDLPIFGGRTHPCVSLRLKEMDKPINILTGIDYWLDNLMCNVPEVVMCYHQNGIVQKYELFKTEDLPHISDSPFSPQLVRDIAHNILSFLKSKAAKEGHTYWLFKGKDDDIVKLYDLTSLCNEENFESSEKDGAKENVQDDNPFTIPVAILLYCVAKKLFGSKDAVDKLPTVRSLLESSLSLINKDMYPKIYCHSQLILADIYLPQDIDPDVPTLIDIKKEEVLLTKVNETKTDSKVSKKNTKKGKKGKGSETVSINLDTLCRHHGHKSSKTKQKTSETPNLSKNVYERCNDAIRHVILALQFLVNYQKDETTSTGGNDRDSEGRHAGNIPDEPKRARQNEPIPMPYEPLNKTPPKVDTTNDSEENQEISNSPRELVVSNEREADEKRSSGVKKKEGKEESKSNTQNVIVPKAVLAGTTLNSYLKDASWIDQFYFKFFRKTSLIYMTKGRIELTSCNYGLCLRYAKLSLRAWCAMVKILNTDKEFPLPSQPLLLAGDVYYNLSKNWDKTPQHIEDFNSLSEEHQNMNEILEKFVPFEDTRWSIKAPCDNVEAMMLSFKCFDVAAKFTNSKPDIDLKRRVASICNELGCIYMNQADQLCQNLGTGIDGCGSLWEDSWQFICNAFDIFEEVRDTENVALLHCNKGRYLRLYAFYSSSVNGEQVNNLSVYKIYEKAVKEYEQALTLLNSKQSLNSQVRVSVVWEFSSTLFGYATLLHEDDEILDADKSSELVSLYNRCLKLCVSEAKTCNSKEPLYEYRIAVIHIRLASIYHQKYRSGRDGKMMSLAEMHYMKSAERFIKLNSSPEDILKVHLDHIVLLEDSLEGIKNPLYKWKKNLSILKLLTDCLHGLAIVKRQREERRNVDQTSEEKKEQKAEDEKLDGNSNEKVILQPLLELLEKKLNLSLLTMLRLSKSENKSLKPYEGDLKTMYSASLNKLSKSIDSHLLDALSSILPILNSIRVQFKMN